jgi:hypothetical protein
MSYHMLYGMIDLLVRGQVVRRRNSQATTAGWKYPPLAKQSLFEYNISLYASHIIPHGKSPVCLHAPSLPTFFKLYMLSLSAGSRRNKKVSAAIIKTKNTSCAMQDRYSEATSPYLTCVHLPGKFEDVLGSSVRRVKMDEIGAD